MKSRAQNEDAWRNAKNICRLNARQVQMARALGMNPKKLLMNHVDVFQRWQSHGTVDPEVLPQLGGELREIADAIDAGAPIPQVPRIPIPPCETRAASSRRDGRARVLDDADIPF